MREDSVASIAVGFEEPADRPAISTELQGSEPCSTDMVKRGPRKARERRRVRERESAPSCSGGPVRGEAGRTCGRYCDDCLLWTSAPKSAQGNHPRPGRHCTSVVMTTFRLIPGDCAARRRNGAARPHTPALVRERCRQKSV